METIEGVCKEVLEMAEWIAIVTRGEDGPHLVGTWGEYVRSLGVADADTVVIPAGRYHKTEENLNMNGDIQLLLASRQVKGNYGPGQGCILSGSGDIQTEGDYAQMAKEQFAWARGALVVRIGECKTQL